MSIIFTISITRGAYLMQYSSCFHHDEADADDEDHSYAEGDYDDDTLGFRLGLV